MTNTSTARRAIVKPDFAPECMPNDPVRIARWQAIRAAGGASHVGRIMGYQKGEAVRLWYVNRDPTAEQARKLVEMSGGAVTLEQILPSAYGKLTKAELGYAPR